MVASARGNASSSCSGLTILSNMRPDGRNFWTGTIYNPDDGNTYRSKMKLQNANTMKVDGSGKILEVKADDDNPNKNDSAQQDDMMGGALQGVMEGFNLPKAGDRYQRSRLTPRTKQLFAWLYRRGQRA